MKVIKMLMSCIFLCVALVNTFGQQLSDVSISNLSIQPIHDSEDINSIKSLMMKFIISDPDLLKYVYITVYTEGDEGNTVLLTKDSELSEDDNGVRIIILDQVPFAIANNTVEVQLDINTVIDKDIFYVQLKGLDTNGKYTEEVISSAGLDIFYSN